MYKKIFPVILWFLFFSFTLAQNPDIKGTYEFVIRVLPDGTRINTPDIVGLMIFTDTHRTANLTVNNGEENFSYSIVSTYNLNNSEYTETNLISDINNKSGNQNAAYSISEKSVTVPVTKTEGKLEITMPFDPVTAVFDGDRIITKAKDGSFTDYWKRIEE